MNNSPTIFDLNARKRIRDELLAHMAALALRSPKLYEIMQYYVSPEILGSYKTLYRFLKQKPDQLPANQTAAPDDLLTSNPPKNIPVRTSDTSISGYAMYLAAAEAKGEKPVEAFGESLSRLYGAHPMRLSGNYTVMTSYSHGDFKASDDSLFCQVNEQTRVGNFIYSGVILRVHDAFIAVLKERSLNLPRTYLLKIDKSKPNVISGFVSSMGYDSFESTFPVEVRKAQ